MNDIITTNYKDIRGHVRNADTKSSIEYVEATDKYTVEELIKVGVYCNNEFPATAVYCNMFQYWTFSDTFQQSFLNAGSIINDFSWEEESKLRSLQQVPGLYVTQIESYTTGYNAKDVNFFLNQNSGMIAPDFNSKRLNSSSAIEMFGYFLPNISGKWTFTIPPYTQYILYSKLWINSDYAVNDYMNNNADICNDKDNDDNSNTKTPSSNKVTINVVKGDIVPLRLQVITSASFVGSYSGFITLTDPEGKQVNSDGNYFVTITEDGKKPYYKNSRYFALVNDKNDSNKFKCFFMDSTPKNIDVIKKMKLNSMVQYVRNPFKLPITTDIVSSIVTNNNIPTDIRYPRGVQVTVTNGKWGGRPDYVYREEKNTPYTEIQNVPSQVSSMNIGNNYGSYGPLSGHTSNLSSDPFTKTVQKVKQEFITHYEPQTKDVTSLESQMMNSNELHLDAGKYYDKFGDPTYPGAIGQKPGIDKLTTTYKTSKVEDDFTNKQLYIDQYGMLALDYTYYGINYTSYLNVAYNPYQWNPSKPGQICPYVLTLENSSDNNTVNLVVKNNGTMVATIPVYKNNGDNREKQVNENWANTCQTQITPGDRLIEGQNALCTSDFKFRFSLENVNATLMFCVTPYLEVQLNNLKPPQKVNVTQVIHLDNNKQMYYLYRIKSRGVIGKKFLHEKNAGLKINNVFYVPNNYNNILQHSSFEDAKSGGYPIISDMYNKDNYVVYKNNEKNKKDCQDECMASNTCNHYFYVKNDGSDTGTCYIDKINNANPIYRTDNPNNTTLGAGTFSVKKDTIISSCEYNSHADTRINPLLHSGFKDTTVYYQPVANQPELTYYCGLARHQNAVQNIKNIYEKKEGFSNPEAFNNNCSSMGCMIKNINELTPVAQKYSATQDAISLTYNTTQERLKFHQDLSGNLADPKYKYNDTYSLIPEQYINNPNPNPQPETNIIQGQIVDMKNNLLVQNTIFTLAAISAASFLIIAMAIGRN
jgi:hypothetical protein